MSKLNINLAEMEEDVDVDDEIVDDVPENGVTEKETPQTGPKLAIDALPETNRQDKTLKEVLDLVGDEYAPVIPDAVTDFYLAKNGLSVLDVRIKRLLALATQKFISDIATDAYEYSRIRSSSALYNSSNPQARARALVTGQPAGQSGRLEKIVLTTDDLSSALSEYGLNVNRPDFYR